MAASWRVNVILGCAAFLFTTLFSIVNNTWQTSLFRAGAGFLVFFLFGYLFRLVLYIMSSWKNGPGIPNEDSKEKETLEEENIQEEPSIGESSFQAIPLHSLHNGEDLNDPEKVAQIIRTMTSQNREG